MGATCKPAAAAATAAKSLQSCPTLCDPIDGSPPGSPSLGFSRQERWSGLPFPSPMRESEVAQSCPTLHNPMDCSLPGSSVHGIFQARVLEWGAITFSKASFYTTIKTKPSATWRVACHGHYTDISTGVLTFFVFQNTISHNLIYPSW